ncbi:hypothetical protein [Hartmannibacter diazotrophicus]|uniref:hypothetical protein n=1 Tax=Hartmannibacter diazotrophicus TaxID=1482074 RepID=UPI0012FD58CF|nr:hypothetical protein [Hartmannibacter diazotrophicus]
MPEIHLKLFKSEEKPQSAIGACHIGNMAPLATCLQERGLMTAVRPADGRKWPKSACVKLSGTSLKIKWTSVRLPVRDLQANWPANTTGCLGDGAVVARGDRRRQGGQARWVCGAIA